MNDKLLDELLEQLEERRPRWAQMRAALKIAKEPLLRGEKWNSMTHKEFELTIRLCEQDRIIAKLQKPKAKAKKKA